MTTWTRTDDGLEATINGRDYLIEKLSLLYTLRCDGEIVDGLYYGSLFEAKVGAEFHSESPTQPKQGVHIDNIAGQQIVDILKRSFTTTQIQDFIDASPYDEPDTGAPEGGPLG